MKTEADQDNLSTEANLASGNVVELPRRAGQTVTTSPPAVDVTRSDNHDEIVFRLQVQLDLQRERELMYRVLLVVEAIALLMIVREWVLWLLF